MLKIILNCERKVDIMQTDSFYVRDSVFVYKPMLDIKYDMALTTSSEIWLYQPTLKLQKALFVIFPNMTSRHHL